MEYKDINKHFDDISYNHLDNRGIEGDIEMNDRRLTQVEAVVSYLLTKLDDKEIEEEILHLLRY